MMVRPKICMVGSSMMDLIARVPRLPSKAETIAGSAFSMGFGGKGSNQAVMAARLGADVAVVVKLGRDVFGDDTLRNYQEQGIDVEHVGFDEKRFSGVAPIAVHEGTGDNTVIIVPGANESLSVSDVDAAADTIRASSVVMCQLETPIDATLRAFRIAREAGTPMTMLNPAPAADLPDEMLDLVDVFVPNEIEAAHYVGHPVRTVEDAMQASLELQSRGPGKVVITLGARGAVYVAVGEEPEHASVEQVAAVDSTGAGDAFVGSLGYFLAVGRPLHEGVERACAIATISVMKSGTQSSFPKRSEVLSLLEFDR